MKKEQLLIPIFILVPFAASFLCAQSFHLNTIKGNFDGAFSVYATDVDGDGDVDVLGAAVYAHKINWWENDGSENFIVHNVASNFLNARSVYATDVDGDGDVDVLGAATTADKITWWENDGSPGDGGWIEHTITSNFNGARSVYATDVDGDGNVDVLGAASSADDITWWEQGISWTGNGDGVNWSDANNWSQGNLPTTNNPVNIGGNMVTISSSVTANPEILVIEDGGNLTISSSGLLNLSPKKYRGLEMTNATLTNNGTITITGDDSNVNGMFINGASTMNNENGGIISINMTGSQGMSLRSSATFNNKTGAQLNLNNITNSGIVSQGTIINENGAVITVNNTSSSAIDQSIAQIVNSGMINLGPTVQRGLALRTNGERFVNNGTGVVTISGSTTAAVARVGNSPTITNNGTFIFGSENAGKSIDGAGSFAFNNNNIVQGFGTIEAAFFNQNVGGKLIPGASPGIFTFDADEDFSSGSMNIEIEDNDGVAGTDFDQIVVAGTATLTGSTLNLAFNYTPSVGHKYKIINATAITGTFGTINVTPVFPVTFDESTGEIIVAAILPVELIDFTAKVENKQIQLTWQTASETNNEGFEIQWASPDSYRDEQLANGNWETIGFINGRGTTNEVQNYQFLHDHPANGMNYYRLKQIDFDGRFEYSNIEAVHFDNGQNTPVQIFPNPVKNEMLTVKLDSYNEEEILIQLFDLTGRNWLQQTSYTNTTHLNVNDLAAGIYLIKIAANGQTARQKVVIE